MSDGVERLAFTMPETAKVFGVSESTIERRIADGSIRVIRIGRSLRIPIREVERLLSS